MDRSQLMRLILEEKLGDDPHFTLIKPIKFNIRGYKKSSNMSFQIKLKGTSPSFTKYGLSYKFFNAYSGRG